MDGLVDCDVFSGGPRPSILINRSSTVCPGGWTDSSGEILNVGGRGWEDISRWSYNRPWGADVSRFAGGVRSMVLCVVVVVFVVVVVIVCVA